MAATKDGKRKLEKKEPAGWADRGDEDGDEADDKNVGITNRLMKGDEDDVIVIWRGKAETREEGKEKRAVTADI